MLEEQEALHERPTLYRTIRASHKDSRQQTKEKLGLHLRIGCLDLVAFLGAGELQYSLSASEVPAESEGENNAPLWSTKSQHTHICFMVCRHAGLTSATLAIPHATYHLLKLAARCNVAHVVHHLLQRNLLRHGTRSTNATHDIWHVLQITCFDTGCSTEKCSTCKMYVPISNQER